MIHYPDSAARYMVIEGTDGAGTTTQKDMLTRHLTGRGDSVVEIAEPGGTPIGDALRLIIKDGNLTRSPRTNLELFTICRRELAAQVIAPSLQAGTNVVSDRNWFSSVAYQGFGEQLDVAEIIDVTHRTLGEHFLPHAAVIIDVPVTVSEARIKDRATGADDHFERKGAAFFEAVREGYLWLAQEFDIPVVDGTQSIEAVHQNVLGALGITATRDASSL